MTWWLWTLIAVAAYAAIAWTWWWLGWRACIRQVVEPERARVRLAQTVAARGQCPGCPICTPTRGVER